MSTYYQSDAVTLVNDDCIETMRTLPDNSVDAIVTDPPYGLGFMGKEWDALPPGKEWADECLRVLKPGGHLLAFGGTRTWHRLAVAVEDAGFEIRDSLAWLYGTGFPKSMDVSKAIDKAAGAERQVLRTRTKSGDIKGGSLHSGAPTAGEGHRTVVEYTAPATDDARQWQGWGTALKPAFEPIVMGRKPIVGTVARNVLTHGPGALNIDASRIEGRERTSYGLANSTRSQGATYGTPTTSADFDSSKGRHPSNVILDEYTAGLVDEQGSAGKGNQRQGAAEAKGTSRFFKIIKEKTCATRVETAKHPTGIGAIHAPLAPSGPERLVTDAGDSGGTPFLYTAKAPTHERPVVDGLAHSTVKPLAIMRYLVKLVTPPGGTVLEPFAGSGTTVEACMLEGFKCIAIEREAEYLPLIEARINRQIQPAAAPMIDMFGGAA